MKYRVFLKNKFYLAANLKTQYIIKNNKNLFKKQAFISKYNLSFVNVLLNCSSPLITITNLVNETLYTVLMFLTNRNQILQLCDFIKKCIFSKIGKTTKVLIRT